MCRGVGGAGKVGKVFLQQVTPQRDSEAEVGGRKDPPRHRQQTAGEEWVLEELSAGQHTGHDEHEGQSAESGGCGSPRG